jgi:hypothetical protein
MSMRSWLAQVLLVLCATAAFLSSPVVAIAGPLSAQDEKQIIGVVQSQLNAFAADDAEKAFSYAAPNIRALLGTAENFLEMVRSQYDVVVHPVSVVFLKPKGDGALSIIKVQLTDGDGDVWTATYTLQRQKNKQWRITGCVLAEALGSMV